MEHVLLPPAAEQQRRKPWSTAQEADSPTAAPVSAAAGQLASQTSHLTLAAARKNTEVSGWSRSPPSPSSSPSGPDAPQTLPDARTTMPTADSLTLFLPVGDAQLCPQLEQQAGRARTECEESRADLLATEAWQEMAADETMGEPARTRPMVPVSSLSMVECHAGGQSSDEETEAGGMGGVVAIHCCPTKQLAGLPNEVLLQILGYLDVCDLLATSRTSQHLRRLSLAPILHLLRLRRTRAILPPMLNSPQRPSLADLVRRSIFLTRTTVAARKLGRNLVSIRLSRRLAARPSAEALVNRAVLPPECVPGKGIDGSGMVAPALVAKKRAVERERVKDGLRRWVGSVWRGEVLTREERVRRLEESRGIGRVWRLRRFWERVGNGEASHSSTR
ncbi:hypothetical protein QBC46DRAFT_364106 [Diplogelasinospora grovesii]|uniref:F-box domain-containing protein n=1 Tax=Diplogelasinospora grovesii TaxID=303347 RepID=A0AAN6N8M0_9PEZI|nr:hypothetical protein QBC46DRAFT_364106 [Diplogelasinospora grovesii]